MKRLSALPLAFALALLAGAAIGVSPAPAVAAAKVAAKGKAAPAAAKATEGATASLPTIETAARNAFIIDATTGTVLYDKGADERIPPASMSKMMFYYTVFTYLKAGKITLDDTLPVSEKAWRTGGSKMFVPLGGRVRVEDLLRGVIVDSGNDACIVLAEGLAGSEEAFVEQENKLAKKLGLTGSHFANVTGLPNPDHYMTARDLAILAKHIINDFPQYYKYESEKEFTYNGIKQGNRNPLLYDNVGADGLKTGHTEEAGYCLTGSAVQDGHRIIMVLAGMPTMKARITESEKMLEWAFRTFGAYTLYKPGDVVDQAEVWLGKEPKVPLTVASNAMVVIPRNERKDLKITVEYDKPIKAPIAKGQTVGKIVATVPAMPPREFPLVAAADVERLGPVGRVGAALSYLIFGGH